MPVGSKLEHAREFGVSAGLHLAIGGLIALFASNKSLHSSVQEPIEFELIADEVEVEREPEPVVPDPEELPPAPAIPTTKRPERVPKQVAVNKVDEALPFREDAPVEPGDRAAPEGAEAIPGPTTPYTFHMTETVGGGDGLGYSSAAIGGDGSLDVGPARGGGGAAGPAANQGARGVKVARDWQITRMPEPRNAGDFEPDYPPVAKREGREAVVVVELDIDVTGAVTAARVVTGPTRHGFRKAALAYAKKLRFEPARAGDNPVASRIEWTVHFYVRH